MLLALRACATPGRSTICRSPPVLTGDEEKAGTPAAAAPADDLTRRGRLRRHRDRLRGRRRRSAAARVVGAARRERLDAARAGHPGALLADLSAPTSAAGRCTKPPRILAAFEDSLSRERYLTVNPGAIVGGTSLTFDSEQSRGTAFGKNNVIAEEPPSSPATCARCRSSSAEAAKATMRRIVASARPHARASIAFTDGYPPLAPLRGNQRLLATLDQAPARSRPTAPWRR